VNNLRFFDFLVYVLVVKASAIRCAAMGAERRGLFAASTHQTDALEGADALIFVTEWREFHSPNFEKLKAKLKAQVIFDGRNLYDPALLCGMGFEYLAFGR
jgi:UDP-glucose 6-dehydrogenase